MNAIDFARKLGLALVLLALHPCVLSAQGKGESLVILAGRVIPVAGAEIEGGGLVVRDGRIEAVGKELAAPAGSRVRRFPKAVIFPGLIDAGTHLGLGGRAGDSTKACQPEFKVAESFDANDRRLREAVELGITSLHVVPSPREPLGGVCGVVKADGKGRARWLRRESGLGMSLIDVLYQRGRAPTSAYGLVQWIEASDHPVVAGCRSGKTRAFVSVGDGSQVDLALRLSARKGMDTVLLGDSLVRDHRAAIAERARGVILDALLPDESPIERKTPALLAKSGIPFAFQTRAPSFSPRLIRLSAVLARRAGLAKDAAHRALTLDAAKLLGVADRIGSLEKGKDADCVVFSHDPTDPRASVLLVVQHGRIVYEREASAKGGKR